MKHIKKLIFIVVILGAAAGAFVLFKQYDAKKDNVEIQKFCLGLCGQDKDGNGAGIGIGASERGPMIGVGPWGSKKPKKNQIEENDLDESEDEFDDQE